MEVALKACILKFVEETGVIFTDKKFAEICWTHRIDDLVNQANLQQALRQARIANATVESHWGIVMSWSEISRYERKSEAEARELFEAVTSDPDKVISWIQRHW